MHREKRWVALTLCLYSKSVHPWLSSYSGSFFVIQLMLFRAAVLVNSTANLISCFMADLQPNTLKENMAAVLSLLATQGLVNKAVKQIMYAYT